MISSSAKKRGKDSDLEVVRRIQLYNRGQKQTYKRSNDWNTLLHHNQALGEGFINFSFFQKKNEWSA